MNTPEQAKRRNAAAVIAATWVAGLVVMAVTALGLLWAAVAIWQILKFAVPGGWTA